MKYILIILISSCLYSNLYPQDFKIIKPLAVGDRIPEEFWNTRVNLVNFNNTQGTVELKHFRNNKLIILDFWATWCGSCIANMVRTHKLQDNNKDVLFIPVSYQTTEKVNSFIKTNHIMDSLNIFSIVDDQILKKYFLHEYLPHFVWISEEGKVCAITGPRELTQSNIELMLSSPATTTLAEAKQMDKKRAFLLSEDIVNSGLKQYSIFVKGIRPEYITQNIHSEINGVIYRKCSINLPLKSLYEDIAAELLNKKGIKFNKNKDILIEINEPDKLNFNLAEVNGQNSEREILRDKWNTNNLYSYDVILPLDKSDQLDEYIFSLLNDSTPYSAKIEKRIMEGKERYMLVIKDDQALNEKE